jgi:MarR family transcriptional regulator, organic hydroperoxide resistance regulator
MSRTKDARAPAAVSAAEFPVSESVGYLIRAASRAYIQDMQARLVPHDMPIGMWFFMRALLHEDGLTQRELSARVGLMDSTTVEQLRNMEGQGYIVRRRSPGDRRKINVYLTAKSRRLEAALMSHAVGVNEAALRGLTAAEIGVLRLALLRIIDNFHNVPAGAYTSAGAAPASPSRRRSARPALPES